MTHLIRPAIEADDSLILTLVNGPQGRPTSLANLQAQRARCTANGAFLSLVASTPEGTVVGYGAAGRNNPENPGAFTVMVMTAAGHRNRGIGGQMYAALESWAFQAGAAKLTSDVLTDDPPSLEFAEARQYAPGPALELLRIPLADWSAAPFQPLVERLRAEGLRFGTLTDEGGDVRRFWDLLRRLRLDIPGSPATPPCDRWIREHVVENPNWNPAYIIIAADGDHWAGVTYLERKPPAIFNLFTGVDPAYRGRGIALALKVHVLERARAEGFSHVRTYVHTENHAMLAVNRKLGYERLLGRQTMTKELST